jgi:hypothetical protein
MLYDESGSRSPDRGGAEIFVNGEIRVYRTGIDGGK